MLCAWASLSVQDFERVGGASGLEGLRRVRPRREKKARPWRVGCWLSDGRDEGIRDGEVDGSVEGGKEEGGRSHGVASSCAAIISSILASPPVQFHQLIFKLQSSFLLYFDLQGASEQYIWIFNPSTNAKG